MSLYPFRNVQDKNKSISTLIAQTFNKHFVDLSLATTHLLKTPHDSGNISMPISEEDKKPNANYIPFQVAQDYKWSCTNSKALIWEKEIQKVSMYSKRGTRKALC